MPKKFDVNVLYFELPKVLITKEFQFIKFNIIIIIIPTVFICTDLHCLCLVFLAINILFLFSNEWKWFALLCFKTCLPWNVKNCSKKKVCLTRLQIDWISKTTFIKNNSGSGERQIKIVLKINNFLQISKYFETGCKMLKQFIALTLRLKSNVPKMCVCVCVSDKEREREKI